MRRTLALLLVPAAWVALAGERSPAAAADAGSSNASAAGCIQSWPEARMQAYGYNHIVHVRDLCSVAADCIITTDVNPAPTTIAVPAKSEAEVNTYLGSPARVFTPKVVCTMRAR